MQHLLEVILLVAYAALIAYIIKRTARSVLNVWKNVGHG